LNKTPRRSTICKPAASDVRLRAAKEVPSEALRRFYERVYPARADFLTRNWQWLYRTEEYPNLPGCMLAVVDSEVIGHTGAIPVMLRRGSEERTSLWFVDVVIVPEYHGQGVGTMMARAWMSLHPMLMGFGRKQAVDMLARLDWLPWSRVSVKRLPLRPERASGFPRYLAPLGAIAGTAVRAAWRCGTYFSRNLTVSSVCPESLNRFVGFDSTHRLHVPRTESFLRWRILSHPSASEYFVLDLDGEYAALARFVPSGACRRLHLLTIKDNSGSGSCENESQNNESRNNEVRSNDTRNQQGISRFLRAIIHWAMDQNVDDIVLITSDPGVAAAAGRWLPLGSTVLSTFYGADSASRQFLGGNDHQWECLDSDFDLMYS